MNPISDRDVFNAVVCLHVIVTIADVICRSLLQVAVVMLVSCIEKYNMQQSSETLATPHGSRNPVSDLHSFGMLHVRYAEAAARLPAAKFEPTQGEAHLASQAERTLQASSHNPPENRCRCDTESKGTKK